MQEKKWEFGLMLTTSKQLHYWPKHCLEISKKTSLCVSQLFSFSCCNSYIITYIKIHWVIFTIVRPWIMHSRIDLSMTQVLDALCVIARGQHDYAVLVLLLGLSQMHSAHSTCNATHISFWEISDRSVGDIPDCLNKHKKQPHICSAKDAHRRLIHSQKLLSNSITQDH